MGGFAESPFLVGTTITMIVIFALAIGAVIYGITKPEVAIPPEDETQPPPESS